MICRLCNNIGCWSVDDFKHLKWLLNVLINISSCPCSQNFERHWETFSIPLWRILSKRVLLNRRPAWQHLLSALIILINNRVFKPWWLFLTIREIKVSSFSQPVDPNCCLKFYHIWLIINRGVLVSFRSQHSSSILINTLW